MAVIGDIVKVKINCVMESQGEELSPPGEEAEPHFTALSRKLETIAIEVAELDGRKKEAFDAKTVAVQDEDYEGAHHLKEVLAVVDGRLKPLKDKHAAYLAERDGICHRILAIVSALLKWTLSDIRKDGVLLGMLSGVVRPILKMKALSEEVNLRALHAIGLFCSVDVELAQNHWEFFTRLVTNLGEVQGDAKVKGTNARRAMLAAATLSDCARLHGMNGFFDRDQILSAAAVLAVVPYEYREAAIYPLCGWMMSFGALHFEEHMTAPQPEIHWALGWMLAEAFSNRARETASSTPADEGSSATVLKSQATDLMVFFNILAKHPGRHGEALLCLAVESIIESGLWRCAVSLPVDAHNHQFTRGFSWPTMFEFVRSRLPGALQLRLWRCCLQVCVTSPALAPWAQIPLALATGIPNAPPGAAELVKAAINLGADADALAPVAAGFPPLDDIDVPAEGELLSSRKEAVKAEEELAAELTELGVVMSQWMPPMSMKVPKGKPTVAVDGALRAVAMRSVGRARRGAQIRVLADKAPAGPVKGSEQQPVISTRLSLTDKALPEPSMGPASLLPAVATPARASSVKQPKRQAAMEMESEAKPKGVKRMLSKTRASHGVRYDPSRDIE